MSKNYSDYSWIKVKRYEDDPNLTWEERYKRLEAHHEKETMFLITEVRTLAFEKQCLEDAFTKSYDAITGLRDRLEDQGKQLCKEQN